MLEIIFIELFLLIIIKGITVPFNNNFIDWYIMIDRFITFRSEVDHTKHYKSDEINEINVVHIVN